MEPIQFAGTIRYWSPDKASALADVDIPPAQALALGGLKQQRVRGTVGGAEFVSNVMPAGGGRLALSVSKAMVKAAGAGVGGDVAVVIRACGREMS